MEGTEEAVDRMRAEYGLDRRQETDRGEDDT